MSRSTAIYIHDSEDMKAEVMGHGGSALSIAHQKGGARITFLFKKEGGLDTFIRELIRAQADKALELPKKPVDNS